MQINLIKTPFSCDDPVLHYALACYTIPIHPLALTKQICLTLHYASPPPLNPKTLRLKTLAPGALSLKMNLNR